MNETMEKVNNVTLNERYKIISIESQRIDREKKTTYNP